MIRFFNHNAEKYPFNLVNNNDKKNLQKQFFLQCTIPPSFEKVQSNISS